MKKLLKLLPLVIVASLTACEKYKIMDNENQPLLIFGTVVTVKMKVAKHFVGGQTHTGVLNELKMYDRLSDPNRERTGEVSSDYEKGNNVYYLNNTEEKTQISRELYLLLKRAKELEESLEYFNPLVGSLAKKWKDSLGFDESKDVTPAVLSDEVIQEELEKIKTSSLNIEYEENKNAFYAQREGDALIDLGAIAKGFALDRCKKYLDTHSGGTEEYLINAGNSSILLGENSQRENGKYIVEVSKENPNVLIESSNSFISTSGISEQNVTIGGQTYSHIINPLTGSAISNYDQITIIAPSEVGNGALGDALSTSLMMSNEDEIKEAETKFGVSVIAIKDGNIAYKSDNIALLN